MAFGIEESINFVLLSIRRDRGLMASQIAF